MNALNQLDWLGAEHVNGGAAVIVDATGTMLNALHAAGYQVIEFGCIDTLGNQVFTVRRNGVTCTVTVSR
jgi:hypothetical protein